VTTLYTVGHGTLAAADFAALLERAGLEALVDVRSFPGSRRNPQYGREQLEGWLPASGIVYGWEPRLGGRRKGRPDSRNTALTHPAFRAYADHMAEPEFAAALRELLDAAAARPTTVMCSESVWWRCHRRLLADAAVLLDGTEVVHLFHDGRRAPHRPTAEARIEDGHLVYDAGEAPLPGMGAG
jgi:uncharacterized protein (DUF488 family)